MQPYFTLILRSRGEGNQKTNTTWFSLCFDTWSNCQNHRITEWLQLGLLEIILSNIPASEGSPRKGCLAPCPDQGNVKTRFFLCSSWLLDEQMEIYTNLLKRMSPDKPETDKSLTITVFCPSEWEMSLQLQNTAFIDFSFFLSLNKYLFSWWFFSGDGRLLGWVFLKGNNREFLWLSLVLLSAIISSLGAEKHIKCCLCRHWSIPN